VGKSNEKSFGFGVKRFLKALVSVPKEEFDRDIEKIKADRKKRKKAAAPWPGR